MKSSIEKFYKKYKSTISEWVVIFWIITPLFMGIVNYMMLSQVETNGYDAYVYYDCYKIAVAGVLGCALVLTALAIIAYLMIYEWDLKVALKKVFDNQKWLLFWAILPIWSLVSIIFSVDSASAFTGASYMAEGYMAHLFGLALMTCASFISARKERIDVLTLFCVITDILAVIMIGYEYSVPFLRGFSAATGVSVFANSNHFGYVLCMAILCMTGMFYMYLQNESEVDEKIRKRKIALFLISIILNSYALMINDTLGAYLAVVITMIVIVVLWRVRLGKVSPVYFLPLLVITILTILSFIGLIDNQLDDSIGKSLIGLFRDIFKIKQKTEGYRDAGSLRWGLWLDSLKAIVKRPILGYGPGVRYDLQWNEIINTLPHNEYIECALFLGIPGLVLYLGGLIKLCVEKCKKLKGLDYTELIAAGALIGYLVSAFVGARRFYTSPYMFVFVGLLISWTKKEDAKQDKPLTVETKEKPVEKASDVQRDKEILKTDKKNEAESLIAKFKNISISNLCAYILCAWAILPVIVSVGFIPISLMHAADEDVILFYYQIMYNFTLVCILGIIGFIAFTVIFSKKRDMHKATTFELLKEKAKAEVWIVLLLALWVWTLVSSLLADDKVTAFIGTAVKRDGFFAYCMYASVFGLAYFIEDKKMIKKVVAWYAVVANFMGLVMMFFEWNIPVLSYMSHGLSSATFMNPNHFGYYLCMSIMGIVGLYYMDLYSDDNKGKGLSKEGIFYIISFAWQIYVLMINNTLGAFLAIAIAMPVSLIFWKVRYGKLGLYAWVPIAITVIITACSYFGLIHSIWGETVGQSLTQLFRDIFTVAKHTEGFEKAGTNRMGLWIEALKLIPQRPIFGFGPESLTGHFMNVNTFDRPHNEYLQMAVFCGIPALLMYLAALITLCVNRCKKLKTISPLTIAVAGMVIGYLISAFFGFTIYYTTPYFFMFFGFVAGSVVHEKKDVTLK